MPEKQPNVKMTGKLLAELRPNMTAEERMLATIFGAIPADEFEQIRLRSSKPEQQIKREVPSEDMVGSLLRDIITADLASLRNPRHRTVLELRFGLRDGKSLSLKEVGQKIGRSRTTAWRDEHAALNELGTPERRRILKSFLE